MQNWSSFFQYLIILNKNPQISANVRRGGLEAYKLEEDCSIYSFHWFRLAPPSLAGRRILSFSMEGTPFTYPEVARRPSYVPPPSIKIQPMYVYLKSSQKYYYYWRPIEDLLETHWRPICLIRDPSETYRWPIRDQHASSETSTCLVEDPSETDMPRQRPTCLIDNPLKTNMPDGRDQHKCYQRPFRDLSETDMPNQRPQHASWKTYLKQKCQACPIKDQSANNWRPTRDGHA